MVTIFELDEGANARYFIPDQLLKQYVLPENVRVGDTLRLTGNKEQPGGLQSLEHIPSR
jgi:hypothetical protein